jgi:hypothetical protein
MTAPGRWLAGAAGGDHHGRPARSGGEHRVDGGHDALGCGEAAVPHVAAGEPARFGLDDVHAARPQRGEVVLHRRVLPHLGVHGRAHHHRGPGGEQGGGEQVGGPRPAA